MGTLQKRGICVLRVGDIVRLHSGTKLPRSLIVTPEGHPPWSDEWNISSIFFPKEVGLVTQVMCSPEGHTCVKLFTSRGIGWLEDCELTNL